MIHMLVVLMSVVFHSEKNKDDRELCIIQSTS